METEQQASRSTEAAADSGQPLLSLIIREPAVLYAAYMPFVENGGLFIPTSRSYRLGDEVFMLLKLMDEPEQIPVAGRVVWITPEQARGIRAPGIGLQFNERDNLAKATIERHLAGLLGGEQATHTM